jgi:DNA-binding GntR family transcriptional regulator
MSFRSPLAAPSFRVLSQHVAESLRRAILSGRFKPGDRLVEHELATDLNVSRAPVRDALRLLAGEGLLTLIPHQGAVISPITPELVVDAFSVRAVLEGMATRLGLAHLTPDDLDRLSALVDSMDEAGRRGDVAALVDQDVAFHRILAQASQRPVLLDALRAIANKTYLLISATRYAFPLEKLAGLHGEILETVRGGDPDHVEQVVRSHIYLGQRSLLRHLRGDGRDGSSLGPGGSAAS